MSFERLGETFQCGECHTRLPAPSEPIEIKYEQDFEALTSGSALPILVDFWAPWCGPCKMVAPEMDKVTARGQGRWLVVKVNTEELPSLASRFDVSAIPLMVVLKGGCELARQAGAMPAQGIQRLIEQVL
jgi:thioredoxin 2